MSELNVSSTNLAIRVKTRVNDTVHIQVQVIELNSVGIGFRSVDRGRNAVVFDYVGDREWVTIGEPAVKSWDPHSVGDAY
jgi:phenylpyruvate tautomerase PptA (4-oxalocrotonate tautomerase family)